MAHELQEYDQMASRELVPWHGLGNIFEGKVNTPEFLEHTGLNWPVILREVKAVPTDDDAWDEQALESFRVTMRGSMNPPLPLGVVSDKYVPLQNRDILDAFDPLIDSGTLEYETGGSLRNCRTVWVLCRWANASGQMVEEVAGDPVRRYLLLTAAHDGTGAIELKPTPVRVVCNNTLQMALGDGVRLKFQHTGDVQNRVKTAVEAVGQAGDRMEDVIKLFHTMTGLQLDEAERDEFFRRVFPDVVQADKHPRAQALMEERRRTVDAYRFAPENKQLKQWHPDSLWTCYNAITRFSTHDFNEKRVKDPVNYQINGQGAALSQQALDAATAWINEVQESEQPLAV